MANAKVEFNKTSASRNWIQAETALFFLQILRSEYFILRLLGIMMAAKNSILLVEDDGNDVLLLEHAFRKANLFNPIFAVNDGEQAIDYLHGREHYGDRHKYPLPILMLLDLKLPRKGGLEVLTWLRKQESTLNRIPVVVFTSSRQSIDINRAYELGANSYLVKPADVQKLSEIVKLLDSYWFLHNERPQIR